MSDQNERSEGGTEVVEQITMDPAPEKKDPKKKEKDPKKVAAGKKLAERNKKAREALAREIKREKEHEKNSNQESEPKAWIPELSFTTVLSIVGIGFTAFDMFMRYYTPKENNVSQMSQPANITIQPPQPIKIGMI